MIVYIYERFSDRLHFYAAPSERTPYNTAVFLAEGYFVFMPDIVYRGGIRGCRRWTAWCRR